MDQHLSKHVNPNKVVENSTAEAITSPKPSGGINHERGNKPG